MANLKALQARNSEIRITQIRSDFRLWEGSDGQGESRKSLLICVGHAVLWSPPDGTSAFSPDDNCVGKISDLFAQARSSVDICVFTITDNRIVEAIEKAHRRRVQIRVISDDDKAMDAGSDIERLDRSGISVRMDKSEHHMHHKFAIFDKRQLLSGSYNWTRSAALNNDENFLVTSDPELLKAYTRMFDKLWRNFS